MPYTAAAKAKMLQFTRRKPDLITRSEIFGYVQSFETNPSLCIEDYPIHWQPGRKVSWQNIKYGYFRNTITFER